MPLNCKMFVWSTGLIEIAPNTPEGAIEVGQAPHKKLEEWLVYARLSYDGKPFVPGIPEASNGDEKLEALGRFAKIIDNKMNDRKAFDGVVDVK